MTEVVPPAVPRRAFNWRATLLIASLALNLVFIGGGVARFFVHERMGRITGHVRRCGQQVANNQRRGARLCEAVLAPIL